jgi:hypothetical protein
MRFAAVIALVTGCASSASNPDLAIPCRATLSGDVTAEESCSHLSLCHPTSNDYEAISVLTANMTIHLDVDGVYTVRSYGVADFRTIDIRVSSNGKQYAAARELAASTASLIVTSLVKPTATPCDGTPHGSASATLVEIDSQTGMASGTGSVSLALAF